jgi:hypothetical protein
VSTPLELRHDPIVEEDINGAEDCVVDDLFDDIEAEDLDVGYTQKLFVDKTPVSEVPPSILSVGFSTARGVSIAPPSRENLAKARRIFQQADGESCPATLELLVPRPSEVFENIELNVCTPDTPCPTNSSGPDNLINGTFPFAGTSACAKENVSNFAGFGFASAAGKKLNAPSAASLEKAQALFQSIDTEIACEHKSKTKDHLDSDAGSKAPTGSFSGGFSSASGKKSIIPSESALKKAQVMFDDIESSFQAEANAAVQNQSKRSKPVPKEATKMRSTGALDLDQLSKRPKSDGDTRPFKTTPVFSNLKAVATKTLGHTRRSVSIGRPSIRSSLSPFTDKRISFATTPDEARIKIDPLKYFDLSMPNNRIRLKELRLKPTFCYEDSVYDIDKDRICSLFLNKGPNQNCVDRRWILNHIELILWKVASTISRFPDRHFYGISSLENILVDQLLYR